MLGSVIAVVGVALLLLMGFWMIRNLSRMDDAAYERQDEYFTPRMKAADHQLQALANRLGAEYQPGIVEWRSFATPGDLASTEVKTPSPVWGGGSVVRKAIDGFDVEVTYGVQPMIPHERGLAVPTTWDVLVPRATVTVQSPGRQLLRYQIHWTADNEVQGATGRALDKAFAVVGDRLPPMPLDVERAHAALRLNASSIWCGKDRVEVIGGPLPRAQNETREFGQGDFEVESMVKMIEQTLAFVRALEKA
jgi:hypothetical protein